MISQSSVDLQLLVRSPKHEYQMWELRQRCQSKVKPHKNDVVTRQILNQFPRL